jgi:hypothetical protein
LTPHGRRALRRPPWGIIWPDCRLCATACGSSRKSAMSSCD